MNTVSPEWRITLRPGMVATGHLQIKIFKSVTAFEGYVRALRDYGIAVIFTSPVFATCQEAS